MRSGQVMFPFYRSLQVQPRFHFTPSVSHAHGSHFGLGCRPFTATLSPLQVCSHASVPFQPPSFPSSHPGCHVDHHAPLQVRA